MSHLEVFITLGCCIHVLLSESHYRFPANHCSVMVLLGNHCSLAERKLTSPMRLDRPEKLKNEMLL